MATILEQLPSGARVAVIRLRSLGDCVLTTPALDVLKRSRPDLEIAVVVEGRFKPIFEGNPDIDALPEPSVARLAGWRPALCLNLHGGTRSMALTVGSGAKFRAGFAHHRYASIYNVRIPTAQEILGVERESTHGRAPGVGHVLSRGGEVRNPPREAEWDRPPGLSR